jgi:hypothetical protein
VNDEALIAQRADIAKDGAPRCTNLFSKLHDLRAAIAPQQTHDAVMARTNAHAESVAHYGANLWHHSDLESGASNQRGER